MHKLILTTMVALTLPALASADISSHTSASSQTGGNMVGPGGKVETGSASASVTTSNVKGSSTSSVYIKTNANGEVYEETHTSNSSSVDVSVQATPKATTIDVREGAKPTVQKVIPVSGSVSGEVVATTSVATGEPATTTPKAEGLSVAATIVLAVQSFFAGIFSWFS